MQTDLSMSQTAQIIQAKEIGEMTDDYISGLLLPSEVVNKIFMQTGVRLSERAVRKKARESKTARQIGRNMFIHISDLPVLFKGEVSKTWQSRSSKGTTSQTKASTAASQSTGDIIDDLLGQRTKRKQGE